jgi:hypothetical protein
LKLRKKIINLKIEFNFLVIIMKIVVMKDLIWVLNSMEFTIVKF